MPAARSGTSVSLERSERAYFAGALGVGLSRGLSILAGILSLWFLTRILTTEAFAGYSVAMAVIGLLSYSVGLGLERSLLVRLGGLKPEPGRLAGARLMWAIFRVTGILAAIGTAVTLVVASAWGGMTADFVVWLSPMIPATALGIVFVAWFQANHNVGVSQSMQGLNDILRSLIFGLVLLIGLGTPGVVAGAIMGACAPLVYLGLRARGRSVADPGGLGFADAANGVQFLLMRLAQMGQNNFDIIAMGLFAGATGTAQYVVATRFARLVSIGQALFAPTFAPRLRRHLETGHPENARREYDVARALGFAGALAITLIFVLLGPFILNFFGEFGTSVPTFMILMAASLLLVGAGLHSTFLSMTSDLWLSTLNRLTGLGVFLVALILLVPLWGPLGGALAYLLSIAVHEAAGMLLMWRRWQIPPMKWSDALILAAATGTLCVLAAAPGLRLPGALVLAALLVAISIRDRALLRALIGELADLLLRRNSR